MGCCNQRRVDNGALAHGEAFTGKVRFDLIEDATHQVVLFKQTAELEKRCGVGRRGRDNYPSAYGSGQNQTTLEFQ